MRNITVTHISKTPLVGAPGRISYFLNLQPGFESIHLFIQDYPNHLKNFFTEKSIQWPTQKDNNIDIIYNFIKKSDIIHIHNELDEEIAQLLYEINPSSKKIYHVHSFLREGPLFDDLSESFPFHIDLKCCVNQLHPRLYQSFTPLPNIISERPQNLYQNGSIPSILFSPTHKGIGRYGTKYSEETLNILDKLEKTGKIYVIRPTYMTPVQLTLLRRNINFFIDEIATGGFHQVSLEALASGAIAINNADFLAVDFYARSIGAKELPPFLTCSDSNLFDTLIDMVDNPDRIKARQDNSYRFYKTYMTPDKLIRIYTNIYKEII